MGSGGGRRGRTKSTKKSTIQAVDLATTDNKGLRRPGGDQGCPKKEGCDQRNQEQIKEGLLSQTGGETVEKSD